MMKVKIFDDEDESDLEEDINNFISENEIEVIDIKYQVGVSVFSEEQVFCFSAMIIYTLNK
ncbi:MAG: sporulation protein Cse60 [Bacilli bacterium]|nr:sporulation protein Cse60 [Bacilli bacterium]